MLKTIVALSLAALPVVASAVEEPSYQVVQTLNGAEIRQYVGYVVAEVVVDASADAAGEQAFPILAGYIFGKNKGARKLDMTAPVTQTVEPMRIDMTAPVTQATAPGGGYLVQFVLPKSITIDSAPEPNDPRVQLRAVPARRVAVIRYSGFWSESNFDEHLGQLQAALRAANITWSGEPVLSRYNPPFTPWFMRRNEIWLAVPPT